KWEIKIRGLPGLPSFAIGINPRVSAEFSPVRLVIRYDAHDRVGRQCQAAIKDFHLEALSFAFFAKRASRRRGGTLLSPARPALGWISARATHATRFPGRRTSSTPPA